MPIQKRCGGVIFRLSCTPSHSQLTALIILVLVSVIIWLEILQSGQETSVVEVAKDFDRYSFFRYAPTKTELSKEIDHKASACPILKLKTITDNYHNNSIPVSCKRIPPVPESCDVARKIFDSHNDTAATCSFQERHEFCQLQQTPLNQWNVLCDPKAAQVCSSYLSLGLPSPTTGELVWEEYQNADLLAKKLTAIVQGDHLSQDSQHFGFAFILCSKTETYVHNETDYYYDSSNDLNAEQLLILPPSLIKHSRLKSETELSFHDLSINLILVDSVSHQHLFRSLPKTVSVLENIDTADVFDFELFQAVKSRTYETLQVIFSGTFNVSEPPFGTHDIPPKPLDLSPIYKKFQDQGYRTLWLEDLCYLWEWGISKDLHFLNLESTPEQTWKRMWSALKKNGVDSVETTLSMCRILEANGVRDHFHGPDAVCFNGKHQHEYLLDYLHLYQKEMKRLKQPYLTVTSTNVGHEDTGRRIQTLDQALADYIAFTPSLENSISIIFSDHGNAYGEFFKESDEALVELYHPFMVFIIPPSSATLLGQEVMDNLRLNSKRLVTALDLHHTLAHIANLDYTTYFQTQTHAFSVSRRGLFDPIDPDRSCNSVPRIRPNVCICENYKTSLDPSSFASLFGYLAVGVINEEIQRLYRKLFKLKGSSQVAAFGKCQPVYLEKVTDIEETSGPNDQRIIQMNIHVQQSQVFVVSLAVTQNKQGELHTVVETVTRLTQYGIYSNCSDATVELSLCICDLSGMYNNSSLAKKSVIKTSSNLHAFQEHKFNSLPTFESISRPLKTNPCLYIFSVRHKDGAAIFSINKCKDAYMLKGQVNSDKKFIYYQRQEEALLLPGGASFLGLVVSEKGEPWDSSLAVDFHRVTLKV